MNVFVYSYYILGQLARMLFGLSLVEKKGMQFLKKIEYKHNGHFNINTFKKIVKFQSIQQFVINDSFALLENRYTNKQERENNKHYFILASVYDDLMDENIISKEELNQLFFNAEKAKPNSFNEAALIDTHLKLIDSVSNKLAYKNVVKKVHQAQMDSLSQLSNKISLQEILEITKRKGGYSLLMCRYYINTTENKKIDECWYQLGGLIQMTNDLYDIYKDTCAGINTFANTQSSYSQISCNYNEQLTSFIHSIKSLPYSNFNKRRFKIILSMIPALGYVALGNLKKISDLNGNLMPFKNYQRKNLIIDMEKIKNIILLFKHSYHIARM